jgi:site-specific recombinase XerD
MTHPYFWTFKKKRIDRLPQTLAPKSQDPRAGEQGWMCGVRAAPLKDGDPTARSSAVEQKVRVLTEAAALDGAPLHAYLKRQGVSRVDYERWRLALLEDQPVSVATTQRLRKLKRALTRKQQALAEVAGLLVDQPDHSAANRRGRRHRRAQRQSQAATHGSNEAIDGHGLADNAGSVRNRRRGMRAPGPPRKFNPSIPPHIDQSKLPKGIYWNNTGAGRWCVFVTDPNTGARNTKVVAGKNARLSVLRAIVGARPRDYIRGSLGWIIARFEESLEFAELSVSTRANYAYCAKVAREYKTQSGRGPSLDTLYVDRLRLPVIQQVIETIGRGRRESLLGAGNAVPAFPTKANHLLRYLHRLFAWGMRHGHCKTNPAAGAKQVKERARNGMPTRMAYEAVLKFAQARCALTPHSAGSLAPYLWPLMEIKYLCRMRSIEVVHLTDAHASERGIYVARRKRSYDNIVRWSPRLRAAWDAAVAVRATIRARPLNKARPMPPPERRFIFVTETATRLSTAALRTSWRQLMRAVVESGVITQDQHFTLHGLKHRGVTDTKGSRHQKQRASGHQTEAMVMLYDHDVPVVSPASPEPLGPAKQVQR